MNGDPVRPGFGKIIDVALRLLDHQMDIERAIELVAQRPEGLYDERPNRDIRHEMSVHHIDVQPVGTVFEGFAGVIFEPGEVGR